MYSDNMCELVHMKPQFVQLKFLESVLEKVG